MIHICLQISMSVSQTVPAMNKQSVMILKVVTCVSAEQGMREMDTMTA